jgi:hypothetical protein
MPGIPATPVPLVFKSLNTKTDPRTLLVGDMVSLNNCILDAYPALQKRNGYQQLGASASAGSQIVPFKTQLLLGTGQEAYGYSDTGLVDKGALEAMTVSAKPVRRDAYTQSTVDSAIHPAGISVYTWETTGGGAQYGVYANDTGQPIIAAVTISSTAVKPKPLVLGPYVVVIYYDTGDSHIRYIAIPAVTPGAPTAATDLATDPNTTPVFDATIIGTNLFLLYANSAGSDEISVLYMTPALVISSEVTPTTTDVITTCCAIFGDQSQNVWIAYYESGGTVNTFAYDYQLQNIIAGAVEVDSSPGTVRNITGIGSGLPGLAAIDILYEVAGSHTYNNLIDLGTVALDATGAPNLISAVASTTGGSLPHGETLYFKVSAIGSGTSGGETAASNERFATIPGSSTSTGSIVLAWSAYTAGAPSGYRVYIGTSSGGEALFQLPGNVTTATITSASGTTGAPLLRGTFTTGGSGSNLFRSIGLASKPFLYQSRIHFLAAYQSALQSTYFLMNFGGPVAKLAPSLGAGLTAKSILPEMLNPSPGVFATTYLQADQLTSVGGNVFSQAGVMAGTFDFTQPQTAVELSDDLHITGGMLSMFDGAQVCEHGFHVYPENLAFTSGGSGSISGSYQACATYEWMDGQGLIHQSAPSPVVTITASSAAYFDYTVQSLRLTTKMTPISVVFWRTTTTGTVFYRVSSISSPNINNKNADTVSAPTHGDTLSDATLAGNAQLYDDPDNTLSQIPSLSAPAPLHVWRYRNRVALIPAENSYQWIFSQAFVAGVPIEFNSQQLYQSVSQDGGPLTCGIEMDANNILFTATRIYYVNGDGPAPNGLNSDYQASPQNIPSEVGCINRRSVVLTSLGVFFQSQKGIYLLGRDLSVQYVGAPVEAFNDLTITAAKVTQTGSAGNRRVMFFTSGGVALVFDLFERKWAVFTNQNAADATLFNGLVTYIQSNGAIMQETPGQFTDNGAPILISFQTGIISFAGINGFQRVYRISLRGDYRSPHVLTISIAYDNSPAASDVSSANAAQLLTPGGNYDTTTYDTENPYDGPYPGYEFQKKLAQQKCTSIQITVQETQPTAPFGEGFAFSAITALVGSLKGLHPVSPSRMI